MLHARPYDFPWCQRRNLPFELTFPVIRLGLTTGQDFQLGNRALELPRPLCFSQQPRTIPTRLTITEVLVVPSFFRPSLAILAAALLITSGASALDTPLSDEAVREAYF